MAAMGLDRTGLGWENDRSIATRHREPVSCRSRITDLVILIAGASGGR